MRKIAPALFGAALLALPAMSAPATAQNRPLTAAEGRYWSYSGKVPECAHQSVLDKIQGRFQHREETYWKSGLLIETFNHIHETGLRANGVDMIPKRFCKAKAVFNDGRVRNVSYWIGENLGMIGWGWGVEWCVSGLDRHRAYGPNCRAVGP
jgi:hypothetical protein